LSHALADGFVVGHLYQTWLNDLFRGNAEMKFRESRRRSNVRYFLWGNFFEIMVVFPCILRVLWLRRKSVIQ
jgi:hypothetical protein